MEEQIIAGRIWAGELRVTAPITPDQDFEFIGNAVQEAIYFDFFGEHRELGDEIDLMIGLCHDPLREDGLAVLRFPAIVTIFDPKLANEDALNLALGMLLNSINGWYDHLELYRLCFVAVG